MFMRRLGVDEEDGKFKGCNTYACRWGRVCSAGLVCGVGADVVRTPGKLFCLHFVWTGALRWLRMKKVPDGGYRRFTALRDSLILAEFSPLSAPH